MSEYFKRSSALDSAIIAILLAQALNLNVFEIYAYYVRFPTDEVERLKVADEILLEAKEIMDEFDAAYNATRTAGDQLDEIVADWKIIREEAKTSMADSLTLLKTLRTQNKSGNKTTDYEELEKLQKRIGVLPVHPLEFSVPQFESASSMLAKYAENALQDSLLMDERAVFLRTALYLEELEKKQKKLDRYAGGDALKKSFPSLLKAKEALDIFPKKSEENLRGAVPIGYGRKFARAIFTNGVFFTSIFGTELEAGTNASSVTSDLASKARNFILWFASVLITGAVIGLGSPFWFDIAKKLTAAANSVRTSTTQAGAVLPPPVSGLPLTLAPASPTPSYGEDEKMKDLVFAIFIDHARNSM